MNPCFSGGFKNNSTDAAKSFRVLMDLLAHPGKIGNLELCTPPKPLSTSAGTILLTLCDPETPIYLAENYAVTSVTDWISFHTGAPFVDQSEAFFAFGNWGDLLPLKNFPIGSPEYPDRSTTIIAEVEILNNSGFLLSGPGIEDKTKLSIPNQKILTDNHNLFPLGLDFYFTNGSSLAALSRSTKIEVT